MCARAALQRKLWRGAALLPLAALAVTACGVDAREKLFGEAIEDRLRDAQLSLADAMVVAEREVTNRSGGGGGDAGRLDAAGAVVAVDAEIELDRDAYEVEVVDDRSETEVVVDSIRGRVIELDRDEADGDEVDRRRVVLGAGVDLPEATEIGESRFPGGAYDASVEGSHYEVKVLGSDEFFEVDLRTDGSIADVDENRRLLHAGPGPTDLRMSPRDRGLELRR